MELGSDFEALNYEKKAVITGFPPLFHKNARLWACSSASFK